MKKINKQFKIRKHQLFFISETLFKKITINFITDFSESQDLITRTFYDMIATIINDLIKYVKFISY